MNKHSKSLALKHVNPCALLPLYLSKQHNGLLKTHLSQWF